MFRTLLPCCLLVLFLSISVFEDLAWSQFLPKEVIITATRLNVRDDVGGNKLGAVTRGQKFELQGTKENWGKIEFEPGRLGWISLQYTQPVAEQRSVLQERALRPDTAESASRDISGVRQALVIGNSDYAYAGMLRNPVNDANAISAALQQLGFEVITITNANQRKMENSIREFGKQLMQNKGVGLFYFAGHGIQFDGENYLLPTDIDASTEEDVRYDAVPLGKLLTQMRSAKNGMNIVVLDACRNNPFARSFRSSSRGLAQVTAPTGSFISYATAPGSVAADGDGENGLFTEQLLKHMNTPGLKLEDVFKQVRVDVQRESGNQQVPWDSSSVTGDFYFIPPKMSSPNMTSVQLSDLKVDAESALPNQTQQFNKTTWEEWQQRMQKDVDKVTEFEKEPVEKELKIEAWTRFLGNWKEDNPHSQLDEALRTLAEARLKYWEDGGNITTLFINPEGPIPWSDERSWKLKAKRLSDERLVYTGEVLNGVPHGKGTLSYPSDIENPWVLRNAKIVGEFANGVVQEGTWTQDLDPDTPPQDQIVKYVGKLGNKAPCGGEGTSTWGDGSVYVGLHICGDSEPKYKNGQGTITYPDGTKYIGEFVDGDYDGKGIKTYLNGNIESGWWSIGEFVGSGSLGKLLSTKECKGCDLSGVDISANLVGADLENANLAGVRFVGAQLMGTNLAGANLSGSSFNGVRAIDKPSGAYKFYANNLLGANLTGADLTNVGLYVESEKIKKIVDEVILCKTKMPDGSINNRDCNTNKKTVYLNYRNFWNIGDPPPDLSILQNGWVTLENLLKNGRIPEDIFIYFGEVQKDRIPSGQGTMTTSEMSSWQPNQRNGHAEYFGEWENGKFNGQGTFFSWKWLENDSFVGRWENGKFNGQGTYTWPDGRKYIGEFKDGKRNGQGTWTHPDGQKYIGEFKDGKVHGYGIYTYPDGEKYVGAFKDGKRNGYGTYTFPDGTKYVGEYKDDKKNGQGTMTFPDGEKYVGAFKDGKRNGQGTYTFPDGRVKSGLWKNDEFLGRK
jgi:hypothetical protein